MSYLTEILFSEIPWTSRNLYGIPYNIPGFLEDLSPQNLYSCYLELFLLFPALIFVSIYVWVVTTISIFHKNVTILIIWSYSWFMIGSFVRFFILMVQLNIFGGVDKYPTFLFLASLLRFEYYMCCPMGIPMVVIERVLATYFISDYEKNHRTWIGFSLLPTFFIFSQFLVFSLFLRRVAVFYTAIGLLISCAFFGFFNILYLINRNTLEKLKRNSTEYSLSKKYQLEENLRIMWYLQRIGVFVIVLTCIFVILIIYPWKYVFDIQISLSDIIIYLDVCIAGGSIILSTIIFYILYKSENSAFLRKIRWLFRIPVPQPAIQVSPVVQNETDIYFHQLQNSWK